MASNTVQNSAIHANRDANLVSNTYNSYGPQMSPGLDPMTILQERVAFGALHDSDERFDAPKCHPETPTAVLNLIDQWAKDQLEDSQPIFWLTGAAGAGKSAIAQTLVERWKKEGMVVLCFFFWRTSSERNNKTSLVPTLSYQLSKHYPSAQATIEEAVRSKDVFRKNMEAQFEELLLRPLETIPADQDPIIVIDGLDECCVDLPPTKNFYGQDFKSQQREILGALAFACQKAHSPRFLIISRPEEVMRTSFANAPLREMSQRLSLNEAPNRDEDIQLFLVCGFQEIRKNYPGLPPSWPEDRLSELVQRSSGQFIYPSTVVKYIAHRRQHPEKSLQNVLDLTTRSKNVDQHPLADLDGLYTLILKSVSAESLDIVLMILGILCYLDWDSFKSKYCAINGESETAKSPYILEELLFLSHGEAIAHLTDLHSILDIPPAEKPHDTIRIVHATLPEYLKDKSRSGDLHIALKNFIPKFCLITLRHLTMDKHEPVSAMTEMPADDIGMCYYVCYCLDRQFKDVPYSKEVKNALWRLLEDEMGDYTSLTMRTTFNSKVGIEIHDCSSCGHAHYVPLGVKLDMVNYLLGCNTSAFEPSLLRRFWIDRRLDQARRIPKRRMDVLEKEHDREQISTGRYAR